MKKSLEIFKIKIRIIENFVWFLVTAPLFVKIRKSETPALFMNLVSFLVWSCLAIFLVSVVFDKTGLSEPNSLFSEIAKNPSSIFGKPFILGVIFLSSFYIYVTLKDLWNEEEIKKTLQGKN